MKVTSIAVIVSLAVVFPAFGQQMSPADQEMAKVRQAMSNEYADAITRKDAAAMADHYTADVVTASLCPESPPVVGREALAKHSEASLKAGLRNYSGKVKQARPSATAWRGQQVHLHSPSIARMGHLSSCKATGSTC